MDMKGLYDSVTVARYIVAMANERRIPINITKVQKLLYIAYGAYLALRDNRLTDEHPQAWPYGPVFPRTRSRLMRLDSLYSINMNDESLMAIKDDQDVQALVNLVFRSFGNRTAAQLTAWSHSEGTPWEQTTNRIGFKWGNEIPDIYIMPYFKSLIKVKDE